MLYKKNNRAIIYLLLLLIFSATIYFGQNYLRQQGSTLLPGNGGEFTLQSDQGKVSLSDFKGKVVVMYFGYMSCPDICPMSMLLLSEAINQLSAEQAEQVQGIFISLDPERDSPEALKQYAQGFYPTFIGLTDNKSAIDRVTRQYGVVYQMTALKNSDVGYVVDHSSVTYVIDQQGVLQYFLPHNSSPETISESILKLLE